MEAKNRCGNSLRYLVPSICTLIGALAQKTAGPSRQHLKAACGR
jgi:hypothetical protein